ncbi:hypothetical protein EcSP15_n5040 (plasmid) [Escherichia coli]|nr:hypothetical protein EcSP15_n5040 [Escherichia coli]
MQNAGGNIHVPSDEVTEWAVGIFSTPYMTPGFLATDRPSCYVILFNYVVYTGLKSGDVARLVWLASTQR